MAYAQRVMPYVRQGSGGDSGSKMPLIIGGVALVYLWYQGYLAAWFPSVFGTTNPVASTPVTSVATGSTTLTANQTAGIATLTQLASSQSILANTGAKRSVPTGLMPIHS
jgi:hypothetical protein